MLKKKPDLCTGSPLLQGLFQVVDMRWGVRDEMTNEHMTTELCMTELRNCQVQTHFKHSTLIFDLMMRMKRFDS